MTELSRCRREMAQCEAYLNDSALLAEWCRMYGATEEQARLGALLGVLDWQAEMWLIERERSRELLGNSERLGV